MTRQMKMFVSLALAHTVVDCYGGIWPMFKMKAGLDLAWAGLLSTVALFIGAGLQPVIGLWADHGHQRRFIVLGTVLTSLSMLLGIVHLRREDLGVGPMYFLLFVILMLVRLGQALYHPAGASLAGNLSGKRRATMLAVFICAGMFGFAFSHTVYSIANERLGGHIEWLLLPAAAIVGLALLWCKPTHAAARKPVALREAVAALVRLRGKLLALYFIQTIVSAVMLGIIFLMPEFMKLRGYPSWLINGGGTAFWILGSVALMIPAGHLADRIGRRRVLIMLISLGAVFFYSVVLVPPLSMFLFIPLLIAGGGCIATINPLSISLGQQLAPQQASTISGVLMGLAWALSSPAEAVVGYLADHTTLGKVGALCVLGTLLFIGLPIALAIPRDTVDTEPTHVPLEPDLVVPLTVGVEEKS